MAFSLSRKIYAKVRYVLVLLGVVGSGASVWICTLDYAKNTKWFDLPIATWSVFAPVAIVAIYAISEYFYNKHDSTQLESTRGQVYIMGYLCTITSLVTFFVLMRINGQDVMGTTPEDKKTILHVIGIALTTSFAGLFAMSLLGHASGAKSIRLPEEVEKQFREDSSEALNGVRTLSKSSVEAAKSADRLKVSLDALAQTANTIRTPLDEGAKSIQSYVSDITKLLDALKQLRDFELPEKALKAMKEGLNGVTDLHEAAKKAKESVNRLEESVSELAGAARVSTPDVGELGAASQASSKEISELKTSVEELKEVLEKYAEIIRIRIEENAKSGY